MIISSTGKNHANVTPFLLNGSRHITNRDAYSWSHTVIRFRTVNNVGMMKGHLAWTQNDIDCSTLVKGVRDGQTFFQNVRLLWLFQVLELSRVRTWHDTKAAIFDCAVCQGNPGGDEPRLRQPPVKAVLMPRDKFLIFSVLAEDRGRMDQDVGTNNVLDRIQHCGMGRQIANPFEVQMTIALLPGGRLWPQMAVEFIVTRSEVRHFFLA